MTSPAPTPEAPLMERLRHALLTAPGCDAVSQEFANYTFRHRRAIGYASNPHDPCSACVDKLILAVLEAADTDAVEVTPMTEPTTEAQNVSL